MLLDYPKDGDEISSDDLEIGLAGACPFYFRCGHLDILLPGCSSLARRRISSSLLLARRRVCTSRVSGRSAPLLLCAPAHFASLRASAFCFSARQRILLLCAPAHFASSRLGAWARRRVWTSGLPRVWPSAHRRSSARWRVCFCGACALLLSAR